MNIVRENGFAELNTGADPKSRAAQFLVSLCWGFKNRVEKMSNLKLLVYPEKPFDNYFSPLPGTTIEPILHWCAAIPGADFIFLETKLDYSCRKFCLMWYAGDQAIQAENDFYSRSIQDAPALFGEDAILLNYHLEAFVLLARSALDISSTLFGWALPDPFPRNRYDSFNKLIKRLLSVGGQLEIASSFEKLRDDPKSWLSILVGRENGRSLRDKIAHQTEFPLEYMELNPPSEKESAVVFINDDCFLTLQEFINVVRFGVVEGFMSLEKICSDHLLAIANKE